MLKLSTYIMVDMHEMEEIKHKQTRIHTADKKGGWGSGNHSNWLWIGPREKSIADTNKYSGQKEIREINGLFYSIFVKKTKNVSHFPPHNSG